MDCGLDGLTFEQPSLVKPQFADDSDIGNIVNRFMKTGQLPSMTDRPVITSTYGLPDNFQDLMNSTVLARQKFDSLPLEERNKYNNDPERWLEAMANEKNVEKSEKVEEASTTSESKEGLREEASGDNEAS